MDNILNDDFLKEHGIKSVKTIGEVSVNGAPLGGYVLIVEFTNGDIVKERINSNMLDAMYALLDILNIRSRKKKLEKIMKST